MSKICEVKMQEDTRVYPLELREIREANKLSDESTTYVEVLSFIRDMLRLVDFLGILDNSNKTIL